MPIIEMQVSEEVCHTLGSIQAHFTSKHISKYHWFQRFISYKVSALLVLWQYLKTLADAPNIPCFQGANFA